MKKEADFYEKLENNKVKCVLCPHNCVIIDGGVGFCMVRQNKEGRLYTLIYGEVSSVAADPIEKKPLYHFYPGTYAMSIGTLGCNMRCQGCQNWTISRAKLADLDKGKFDQNTEFVSVNDLVKYAKVRQCDGIAWTYNEPSIWFEYALEGVKAAKENDLYTVFVTNGYINHKALDQLGPYLDAYSVDLKGFNKEYYKKFSKIDHYEEILKNIVIARKKWDMMVEITTNVVPTFNDDPKELKKIASWIKDEVGPDTPWHISRFHPCLELVNLKSTPIKTLKMAREIGVEAGLHYVYIGNVPGEAETTYCPNCEKAVLERFGFNLGEINLDRNFCRFCGEEINIVV